MSFRRLLAVAHKEFYHIARDPRTLLLVTIGPAFLLITMSYIFALDVDQLQVAIRDMDQTPLSRQLAASLVADGDLTITRYVTDNGQIEMLFARDGADLALMIPRGFADALLGGGQPRLQCIIDGADSVTASQTVAIIESRVTAFAAQLLPSAPAGASPPQIEVSQRAWYNPSLRSLTSMVPGMLAIILCMPVLALAIALAREKETGSFESLIATPVQGIEYMLGKVSAYLISGMLSAALAWLVATFWFGVPFRGSLGAFFLLTADYLLAGMGIGMLLANFVRSQQTITFTILTVFFIPSFFIAGLIVPVTEDPLMRLLAHALPSTHFITISRGVFLKGLGPAGLRIPALLLLAMGIGTISISLVLFRKRVL